MTVLVSDSFNRANSTTSLGTTDSYNGGTAKTWASATTYGISSNQAQKQTGSASANSSVWIDGGVSDGKATITFSTLGNHCRLVFRRTDDNNCFWVYANGTTNYQILKRQLSTNTVLATISVVPTNGDIINATFNGSSITVQINGANDTTITNTFNQTATQFGFVTDDSVARLDNFQIEDLATSGTTYTGSGTTQGSANLLSSEHYWYNALGTVQGYANTTSLENYIYSAIGTAQGISALSSSEKMLYSALGTTLGYSAMTSLDIVTMMASGIAQGYADITNIQPQLVSIVRLIGKQELTIILTGQESIDTVLKGQQIVNVNLKGVFK